LYYFLIKKSINIKIVAISANKLIIDGVIVIEIVIKTIFLPPNRESNSFVHTVLYIYSIFM